MACFRHYSLGLLIVFNFFLWTRPVLWSLSTLVECSVTENSLVQEFQYVRCVMPEDGCRSGF
jgi:hypothetical protein